jgi:hypothetical protein
MADLRVDDSLTEMDKEKEELDSILEYFNELHQRALDTKTAHAKTIVRGAIQSRTKACLKQNAQRTQTP